MLIDSFKIMLYTKYTNLLEQTMELTEQQQHLQNVISQQNTLIAEMNQLQSEVDAKRQQAVKLQGIMEYLTELGVSLPEPEEPVTEAPEESGTAGKGFAE